MMKWSSWTGITGIVVILLWACNDPEPVNPFDGQVVHQDTVRLELINPEPASIAGIYKNILKPTCANVGCHDGTLNLITEFQSAYNTLVVRYPSKMMAVYIQGRELPENQCSGPLNTR
jgi:hypothetical protein